MLSERDLKLMRAQQDDALPQMIRHERRILSDDGFGGKESSSRTVLGTGIPARITPGAMLEGLGQLGRPVESSNYIVRVSRGQDFRDLDYIILEGDEIEMQIERVKVPRSWDTVLSMTAEIVK